AAEYAWNDSGPKQPNTPATRSRGKHKQEYELCAWRKSSFQLFIRTSIFSTCCRRVAWEGLVCVSKTARTSTVLCSSHSPVIRSSTAFRSHPINDLVRIHDVAGLAVYTV